jgi:ankyrin repeat protein
MVPAIGETAGADAANAAQEKDLGALRALVQRRIDVNAVQPDGTTALHWAVVWNNEEAISLLLRAGANVNARNRYGATALSEAGQCRKRRHGRGHPQGWRRREDAHD